MIADGAPLQAGRRDTIYAALLFGPRGFLLFPKHGSGAIETAFRVKAISW